MGEEAADFAYYVKENSEGEAGEGYAECDKEVVILSKPKDHPVEDREYDD